MSLLFDPIQIEPRDDNHFAGNSLRPQRTENIQTIFVAQSHIEEHDGESDSRRQQRGRHAAGRSDFEPGAVQQKLEKLNSRFVVIYDDDAAQRGTVR